MIVLRETVTKLLITVLKLIHLFVLLFVIFGWILPSYSLLLIHLVFIPVMIGQWQLNQGTCILTNIENYLRGNQQVKNQQQGQFIKGILGKVFNPLPTDATIKKIVYVVIAISWLVSAFRVWWMSY